jgi:hypothetical protein
MIERERLMTYADALVLAGQEEGSCRPHALESVEELVAKESSLASWSTGVKLHNATTASSFRTTECID